MHTTPHTNEEQATLWNGTAGQAWVRAQALLDAMLQPVEDHLIAQLPAASAEHLLDIGCGTGSTTLAAARRLGPGSRCVGIDISAPMTAAAQARVAQRHIPARFICADAQTHNFEPAAFDRLISRFGVMFFADPVAAFANLRRAATDGARLQLLTWRSPDENPFMTTAERAAAPLLPQLPARQPEAPGQFAFADAARVTRILQASGWHAIAHQAVDLDCRLPASDLVAYFTQLGPLGRVLGSVDAALRERVIRAVRAAFDPYVSGDEVRFTAACWNVTASAAASEGARHD